MLVAVLTVCCLLALSACGGIPKQSAVQPRLAVGTDSGKEVNRVSIDPLPPQSGATREQVAAGFIKAHIGTDDAFATAKDFMAPAAQQRWGPDQSIVVLRDHNLTITRKGNVVTVSAVAIAQVSSDGHLSELPEPKSMSVALPMAKVGEDWRVAQVPPTLGLWLAKDDFTRLYTPRQIFYGAIGQKKVLVPDTRWLSEPASVTAMAKAVLTPPPAWLSPAVRHQMPAGIDLPVQSVPVSDDGTAQVELPPEIRDASPADRVLLWACMLQTLSLGPKVQKVEVTVGGAPLQVPQFPPQPASAGDLGYQAIVSNDGPAILRDGEQLQWETDTLGSENDHNTKLRPEEETLPSLPAITRNWTLLAADSQARELAAVSGDLRTISRWVGGHRYDRPAFATGLVRPSYDGDGSLWLAGRALATAGPTPTTGKPDAAGPATVWVIDTGDPVEQAQPKAIDAPWLAGRDVLALEVSAEGQRVALVVRERNGGRTSLLISAIQRDPQGEVESLTPPRVVNDSVTHLTDVSWVNSTTLAVVGKLRSDPSQERPILVNLDGFAAPLRRADGAVRVVGGTRSQDNVSVVTNRDTILVRQGEAWKKVATGQDLVVPAPQ
ncbi:hypothetical protein VV02_10780 [Luteipulveratus mongoliensis]|uniref:GerMN domain-containing protein n=1 Tax=Luteipulveratus mongoliensis TaxID=571913 RepID=A0A0K1JHQ2_9MICO|nr:hypothetical protein VV02_10780 [Luteipulveratus mongoliensis]